MEKNHRYFTARLMIFAHGTIPLSFPLTRSLLIWSYPRNVDNISDSDVLTWSIYETKRLYESFPHEIVGEIINKEKSNIIQDFSLRIDRINKQKQTNK